MLLVYMAVGSLLRQNIGLGGPCSDLAGSISSSYNKIVMDMRQQIAFLVIHQSGPSKPCQDLYLK